MATYNLLSKNTLAQVLRACEGGKFTGQLEVKIKNTQLLNWSLYFHEGNLMWCTCNLHPIRRWYRLLLRHCPQFITDNKIQLKFQKSASIQGLQLPPVWEYQVLVELTKQEQIQQWQIQRIVEDSIVEILFDILHWTEHLRYRSGEQLTYRKIHINALDSMLVKSPTEQIWRQAIKLWDTWQRSGLADLSPNQAPVILQAEVLRQQTSASVYRNLTSLADGHQTFRDLAVRMNWSLLLLAQPIMPFIQKRLIELRNVEDYGYSIDPIQGITLKSEPISTSVKPVQLQGDSLLVACIDDSPNDSQIMNKIITEAGYQCINIQDSVQALPKLIECKPGLIFLDLVMPIANGYEICAQIRRISIFQDTPVIILSSNDGMVDRVRAKMVGSSGFLSKPITPEKILATLQKYYSPPKSIQSQKQSTEWAWFPENQVLSVK